MSDLHYAIVGRRETRGGAKGGQRTPAVFCDAAIDSAVRMSDADAQRWMECRRSDAERMSLLRRIAIGNVTTGRRPDRARARRLARWAWERRLISQSLVVPGDGATRETVWAAPTDPSRRAPRDTSPEPELRECIWGPPLDAAVLSPYGPRRSRQDPSVMMFHGGEDYPSPIGTPVHAIADGVVEHATVNGARGFGGYGRTIIVRHPQWSGDGGELRSMYAHLDATNVFAGDRVRAGTVLGTVGNTNGSLANPNTTFERSNPHLHFELAYGRYPRPPVSQRERNRRARRIDPAEWMAGQRRCSDEEFRGRLRALYARAQRLIEQGRSREALGVLRETQAVMRERPSAVTDEQRRAVEQAIAQTEAHLAEQRAPGRRSAEAPSEPTQPLPDLEVRSEDGAPGGGGRTSPTALGPVLGLAALALLGLGLAGR